MVNVRNNAKVSYILHIVEIAGFEPASKQGINTLSTRLSWPWFSSGSKTQATNYRLICFVFTPASQPASAILCISAPLDPFSPQTRLGVTSRVSTLCRHKANLLYFGLSSESYIVVASYSFTDDIYERLCSARHAYIPVIPAVKTNYPQIIYSFTILISHQSNDLLRCMVRLASG